MKRFTQKRMILSGLSFAVYLFCFHVFIYGNAMAQIGTNHQLAWGQNSQEIGLSAQLYHSMPLQSLLGLRDPQTDDEWDDWDENWDDVWTEGGGSRISAHVRYNRVEGLYLGARMKKDYWIYHCPTKPFLYGLAGYALNAKKFEYQIGLETGFFDENRLAVGGEYHHLIDTPDRWVISDTENALAAFFLKEDFHDFFTEEGGSGYISQNLAESFTLSVGFHYNQYDSLKKNTNWSLFGGKKQFPENPSMNAGEIRSLAGQFTIDTRNSVESPTRGWYVQFEYEHAGDGMKSDFHFDRFVVDIRRYQSLGYSDGFDFRLRIGSSKGSLPWQKSYHLGGLSTLRGFPYKALPDGRMFPGGNRMILTQLEYRMGSQDLPDEIGLWILEQFNIILFADAGWVGYGDPNQSIYKGFKHLTWSDFKSDVGIAISNQSGNVRLEIARRTDTGYKPFTFLFRISRSF
ncbi:BamA/TamA family outer membrane protein [bacterium]|nr:BamA/TamA family outer membrane protein [bacterium]